VSAETDRIAAMVDVLAPALGLVMEPDMRPQVVTHLEIAARMAALLESFPLDEREEPAPVYLPTAIR
jgi:hypothetical protein